MFKIIALTNLLQFVAIVLMFQFTDLGCVDPCGISRELIPVIVALFMIDLFANVLVLGNYFLTNVGGISRYISLVLISGFMLLSYNFRVRDVVSEPELHFINDRGIIVMSSLLFGILLLMVVRNDSILHDTTNRGKIILKYSLLILAWFNIIFALSFAAGEWVYSIRSRFLFITLEILLRLTPIKGVLALPASLIFWQYSKIENPNQG